MDDLYTLIIMLYFFAGICFASRNLSDILDILDISYLSNIAIIIYFLAIIMWLPFVMVNYVIDNLFGIGERIVKAFRNRHEVDENGFEKEEY